MNHKSVFLIIEAPGVSGLPYPWLQSEKSGNKPDERIVLTEGG